MKTLIPILFFLLFFACSKKEVVPGQAVDIPKPEAVFSFVSDEDGLTTFSNASKNADTFEWDFGDTKGKSNEKTPSYQYSKPGKYKVILKANGKGGSTTAEQDGDIKIIQKDIVDLDKIINDFITKYNLPGASFAIAKNEKLVYAKGYGFANIATQEKMTTVHQLRVASCSKPYCGMAIMKLVEQKKLKLTDKVFGTDAVLGTKFGTKVYTDKVKSLTVSQLLHNTSGFFCMSKGDDPINRQAEMDNSQFLNWVMDNSIFEFEPGSAYHYNNTNFFVASIIVEQLSGMPYADFLKKEIFDKIGDNKGAMVKNNQPFSSEVNYYGQGNLAGNESNFDIERYKGGGANITSGIGLLKFVLAINGQPGRKDLLSNDLLKEYTSVPTVFPSWGHGLGIWGSRQYMYGSLPGTRSAWMMEPSTGITVSLIFNGNLDYSKGNAYYDPFVFAVQDLLVDFITKNRNYQNIDQFAWE